MHEVLREKKNHGPAENHSKKTAACFLKRPTVHKDGPQKGPLSCPPMNYAYINTYRVQPISNTFC